MSMLHASRSARTVSRSLPVPVTTTTLLFHPSRLTPSRPFGKGILPPTTPTEADRAWNLGYELGRDGIDAVCDLTDPELIAAWSAGYAAGKAESDAAFDAWVAAMEDDAAREIFGNLMGLADLVRHVHDAEMAECGSQIGHGDYRH